MKWPPAAAILAAVFLVCGIGQTEVGGFRHRLIPGGPSITTPCPLDMRAMQPPFQFFASPTWRRQKYGPSRGAELRSDGFLLASRGADMRACFLGQNICALGFGVAMV